jgi:hypothetical protein
VCDKELEAKKQIIEDSKLKLLVKIVETITGLDELSKRHEAKVELLTMKIANLENKVKVLNG